MDQSGHTLILKFKVRLAMVLFLSDKIQVIQLEHSALVLLCMLYNLSTTIIMYYAVATYW